MSFEEYWSEVEKLKVLPHMAIVQLPASLSIDTKQRLMRRSPEEKAEILRAVIDEIDHGSVESIDSLVRKSCD